MFRNNQELYVGRFPEWSGIMHGRMSGMVRNCAWEDFWNVQESFRNDQESCIGECLEWSGIVHGRISGMVRNHSGMIRNCAWEDVRNGQELSSGHSPCLLIL